MMTIDEIRTIAQMWDGPKSIRYCGHSGDGFPSEHENELLGNRMIAQGHGACIVRGCECTRFTWKQYTPEFNEATK